MALVNEVVATYTCFENIFRTPDNLRSHYGIYGTVFTHRILLNDTIKQ